MKKITFLIISLVIGLTGYSQELVTNGDFESAPSGAWFGNAFNIVDQGGNSVNQAEIVSPTPGQPFNVNLSQVITLQDGLSYQLTFDAYTDATTGSRTIVAGLGQNGAPFQALIETVTITDTPQTFTYTFTVNYGEAVDDRVLFDLAEEAGFVFIDNVSVMEVMTTCNNGVQDGDETGVDCGGSCPPCPAAVNPPTSLAPTPPNRPANSTVSIYGDGYGTPIGLNNVGFDDPSQFVEESHAGGDVLKVEILNGNFIGASLGTQSDASDMLNFHLDVWISDAFEPGQVLNLKLSNHNPAGSGGESNAYEFTYAVGASDAQSWVSIDVPISDWTNVETQAGFSDVEFITEFLITTAGTIDIFYIDNFYFHQDTLGTETFDRLTLTTFPNPTRNEWNIRSENINIQTVEVYNTLGKLVKTVNNNSTEATINASDLSSGIYFAKVNAGSANSSTVKLIKQ